MHNSELLVFSIDEVGDLDLVWIAIWTIVCRFEADTINLKLLAIVQSYSDPGFLRLDLAPLIPILLPAV